MKKVIYYGIVKDDNDPAKLGRIRVWPEMEAIEELLENIKIRNKDAYDSNTKDLLPEFKWLYEDPLVFTPLFGNFLNIIPKKGERVCLIYATPEQGDGYKNQFYFIHPLSNAKNIYKDDNRSAKLSSGEGDRLLGSNDFILVPNTNDYQKSSEKGLFPNYEDIAIQGRGTSDIIVKESEILLRVGKCDKNNLNQFNETPANDKKSFLQITEFDTTIVSLPAEPIVEVSYTPQAAKYLVEYNIQNPENPAKIFTGQVFLYRLPSETLKYDSDTLVVDSVIDENDKIFMANLNFQGKTLDETGKIISDFIKQVYDGIVKINDDSTLSLKSGDGNLNILPFYYRPTPDLYKIIKNYTGDINDAIKVNNINLIMAISNYDNITNQVGYGVVKTNGNPNSFTTNIIQSKDYKHLPVNNTNISMGSDKIYFLSYNENTLGEISYSDTSYGLGSKFFLSNDGIPLENKTNSMVRGEKLIALLSKIIGFMATHVHPCVVPAPPTPTSLDGTSITDITQQLAQANQTILNKNIRIN
jgi:hypothetical protein